MFIDDEEANLNSFRALFRRDYRVHTVTNGDDAMRVLRERPVQVVMTDMRMPEESGVEILARIQEEFPEPVRILTTGFSDIGAVIEAVNTGNIYHYLKKPWEEGEVRMAIEKAYRHYERTVELREKNEELQKRNEELSKFIYSISHDLRAPLTSMRSVIDVCKLIKERNELDEYFSLLEGRILHLEEFIQNMIDYYKNSMMEFNPQQIDFNDLIGRTIERCQQLGENGVRFQTNISQDFPFLSDEFRLEVIMNNLISNAVKYQQDENEDKFVEIDVLTEGPGATVRVRDNGIGIPENHMQNIFDMFYRATSEKEGVGIGLYLVKESIEKLEGTVHVDSQPNKGTVFEVKVPNCVV